MGFPWCTAVVIDDKNRSGGFSFDRGKIVISLVEYRGDVRAMIGTVLHDGVAGVGRWGCDGSKQTKEWRDQDRG